MKKLFNVIYFSSIVALCMLFLAVPCYGIYSLITMLDYSNIESWFAIGLLLSVTGYIIGALGK
jgi:hypothetical protein